MIDFIKKLFVGVLSFLSGLLKGKQPQPQLNESNLEKPKPVATTKVEKPKPAATSARRKSRGYFMELDEDDQAEIPNGTQAAPTMTKAEPAKKTLLAAKVESKTPEVEKPAKVELVQTAKGVKVEAVTPVASTNGQGETTFAPKYLMPSATSARRRPGPNMNPFLDMARQVNTPS